MHDEEKMDMSHDLMFQNIMHRKKDVFFVISGIFLGIFFEWNVVEILIFIVFLWSILGPISSRYLTLPTLFLLAFIPVLLSLDRKEQAEEFAIYAYYFFVMVVIRGIIEVRAEKDESVIHE